MKLIKIDLLIGHPQGQGLCLCKIFSWQCGLHDLDIHTYMTFFEYNKY